MHVLDGRRMRIHSGNGFEVDVVNRKLLPTIDKIKTAAARSVDGRYMKFHGLYGSLDIPGPQTQATGVSLAGILDAKSNRCQHGMLIGHSGVSESVGRRSR